MVDLWLHLAMRHGGKHRNSSGQELCATDLGSYLWCITLHRPSARSTGWTEVAALTKRIAAVAVLECCDPRPLYVGGVQSLKIALSSIPQAPPRPRLAIFGPLPGRDG